MAPLCVLQYNVMVNRAYYAQPERTKQMEPILKAKVKILFKSENYKKCFFIKK